MSNLIKWMALFSPFDEIFPTVITIKFIFILTFKLHPLAKILPHWSQLNLFIFMKICNFNPVILVIYEGWGEIFATKNTNEFKVFFITNFLMKNLKLKTFRINCLIAMFVNRNLTNVPLEFILASNKKNFKMMILTNVIFVTLFLQKYQPFSTHKKCSQS